MPPKGWRKTASGFQPTNSSGVAIADRKVHGIDELLLPRTLVVKIAKQALPEGTPLPKDCVTALMRSTTMFISYITAEANRIARTDMRKTVTPQDVAKALEAAYFGAFVNPVAELSAEMQTKTPASGEKGGGAERDADDAGDDAGDEAAEDDDYIEEDDEPEGAPPPPPRVEKKQKTGEDDTQDDEMHVDA